MREAQRHWRSAPAMGLVGVCSGMLYYLGFRALSIHIPFNNVMPYFVAMLLLANSFGAYQAFRRAAPRRRADPLWPFLSYGVFLTCVIINQGVSTHFLIPSANLNFPVRPPTMAWAHLAAEALLLASMPAIFYALGRVFARQYQQSSQPHFGYCAQVLGFAAGGASGYWLIQATNLPWSLAAAGLLCLPFVPRRGAARKLFAVSCVVPLFLGLLPLDKFFTWSIRDYKKLSSAWSPYHKLDFLEFGGQCIGPVYHNVVFYYSCQDPTMDHLQRIRFFEIAAQDAKTVLIVGASTGIATQTIILANPEIERITAVELDPVVVREAKGRYARYNNGVFLDRRVEAVAAEGRTYLENHEQRYDIIYLDGIDNRLFFYPSSFLTVENHLFTQEALRLMLEERLTANGVFVADVGGTTGSDVIPYIRAMPEDAHYEVFWYVVSEYPLSGLALFFIVASKDEAVLAALTDKLKTIPSIDYVPPPPVPRGYPMSTDDRPIFGEWGLMQLITVTSVAAGTATVLLLAAFLVHLARREEDPRRRVTVAYPTVAAIGMSYYLLELFVITQNAWRFAGPALGCVAVTTSFLLGGAGANFLYGWLAPRYREWHGLLAAALTIGVLRLNLAIHSPAAGLACAFGAGLLSGVFWPRIVSLLPEERRGLALAIDGVGTVIGLAAFQALFITKGLTAVAVVIGVAYGAIGAWLLPKWAKQSASD